MPTIKRRRRLVGKRRNTGPTIIELKRLVRRWIDDGESRRFSPRTIQERRLVTGKLFWFLRDREYPVCGTDELRAFLAYVNIGHESDPNGRWGNARFKASVKPRTSHAYYRVCRALFTWAVETRLLPVSPMSGMKPPKVSADQIQPFTPEQVESLLGAAQTARDYAVVLFMLDTGARASEVCSLRVPDVDFAGRKVKVAGKGGKSRTVFLSPPVTEALADYLRTRRDGPLFLAERGRGVKAGRSLTRYGLQKLIRSLGIDAGVVGVRCSPHTLRHTFAVEFIRGGGNSFALKELLGHSSLDMTNRYVALALADLENQHRNYSPATRLLCMRRVR